MLRQVFYVTSILTKKLLILEKKVTKKTVNKKTSKEKSTTQDHPELFQAPRAPERKRLP